MAASAREAGFTYVGLIVLVAIIGLVGAATLKADALLQRAAAEEELLDIGAAFSAALTSYAEATPRGQPPQPPSLDDLLKDTRVPGIRRHLRKIFVDPITGKAEWGIVWLNKGSGVSGSGGSGVVAVYSLSQAKPLKQAHFDTRFQNLEGRQHFTDWKFAAIGQGVAQGQQAQPGQPAQPPLFGQPGQPGQAGQPGQPAQPGQTPQNPAEPPSLFPVRGEPGAAKPSPAEPSPPSPAPDPASPPDNAKQPEPAEPPPPSEASGPGDDKGDDKGDQEDKDNKDEKDASEARKNTRR
jgi:type II secretory pathway pseudopilin PulG